MSVIDLTPSFAVPDRPTETRTHVVVRPVLDGKRVRLDFALRAGQWTFDTYSGGGVPLIMGLGLSPGTDLWYPFRHFADLPPGKLFVSPCGGLGYVDPEPLAFVNGTHLILYEEAG